MLESDSGGSTLDETIVTILLDRGPLSLTELTDAVQESGFDLGTDPEEELLTELYDSAGGEFRPLTGGRWAYAPPLVSGRTMTHRLTELEVAHDVVSVTPDLALILTLPNDSDQLRLVDGGPLAIAYPRWLDPEPVDHDRPDDAIGQFGSVLLPAGTLAGLSAFEGDIVSLTITDRGVELITITDSELLPHPEAVRQGWAEIVRGDAPIELETATLSVCADIDEAFRAPHSSLTELFAEVGVARNGGWVASAGFDFAGYWAGVKVKMNAERYELGPDEALAVTALSTLHGRLADRLDAVPLEDPDDDTSRPLLSEVDWDSLTSSASSARAMGLTVPFLADPDVASALLEETVDTREGSAEALALMAEFLEEQANHATRPALRWLRAKAYESLGRVSDAEATLHAAERLDPSWPLTLLDLARYASDRGDALGGLALLARAAPYVDDDLEELLRRFQPQPGPTVGRNEPCWCGSGRKFKQCHLRKTTAQPLEERAAWLYQKAGRFLGDGPWYSAVLTVATERSAYAEDEAAIEAAAMDPLVGDAVLFEGGAFEDFVAQRGFLLPEDERLLAEQWLLVDRSVFDVTAVRRGAGFTARDLRSGDTFEIRDRAASRGLRPGDLICARVVPAGDTMQIFGGIEPVALQYRDALLDLLDSEPDPDELVAFLSHRFAPPTLVNTEGDPLVIRDVVLAPSDPDSLSAALDGTYRRIDDTDPPQWIFERLIDGLDRICATLRLSGSNLHVNTNSDRRMDDVLATIRELDPGAAVTSDERQPITNTRDAARLAKEHRSADSGAGTGPIAPEDLAPELREALTAHMRSYEERWLDMAIPALHGLTPREAAIDPTRREDLAALLASFDTESDSPMEMSSPRLRAALGLEPRA
jgi:tetratricopeptide (TPR) repeat protein